MPMQLWWLIVKFQSHLDGTASKSMQSSRKSADISLLHGSTVARWQCIIMFVDYYLLSCLAHDVLYRKPTSGVYVLYAFVSDAMSVKRAWTIRRTRRTRKGMMSIGSVEAACNARRRRMQQGPMQNKGEGPDRMTVIGRC